MVNEWIPIELYGFEGAGDIRRATIADGVSVSKGALLQLLDPKTASYGHLANVPIIGVAAEEHLAGRGITEISVYTNGLFDVLASGSIGLGTSVIADLSNAVKEYNPAAASSSLQSVSSHAFVLGRALETASNNEVVVIRLQL